MGEPEPRTLCPSKQRSRSLEQFKVFGMRKKPSRNGKSRLARVRKFIHFIYSGTVYFLNSIDIHFPSPTPFHIVMSKLTFSSCRSETTVNTLRLLIDPIELCHLVRDDFAFFEPKCNLLLGVLNTV